MTPAEFIAALAPPAVQSMKATGIPASFVIAEGGLESGWGNSQLATAAFNLFGVKADASWHGPTFSIQTRECLNGQWVIEPALWRKYDGWLGCITDHAAFFHSNRRYGPALAYKTGPLFAKAIALAGYATDPDYAEKLTTLISEHNLASYDDA